MEKDLKNVHVSEEEEEMIDSLFFQCDVHNEGTVKVQTVIQYLTNCLGKENNETDLLKLSDILEAESLDGIINFSSYRDGVKHWITEIKSRCTCMDGETMFEQVSLQDGLNIAGSSLGRSQYSIETSGVNDGLFPTEQDAGELLTQIEGLKFQNHKLAEENATLYGQLEAQEESSTSLATELHSKRQEADTLRKKIKSLQELTDQQKAVVEENEDLKSRLAHLQEGKRELDRKLTSLEEEKTEVENQAKQLECMWQKTQSELDHAKQQLKTLNTSFEEQKMLLQAQDTKESMAKKEKEIADLAAKLKEALAQNEKLQEGKNEVEQRLTRVNSKYLRVQSKVEQLGLTDVSLTEDDQIVDFSRHSPKVKFSTPCTRNSICMELMDRLNEEKHLASPLCEMIEQSNEWPLYCRSVVLPPYMSTWEFDLANASLQEYSHDMLKNRKSLSPDFFDSDVERRLLSMTNLEKGAMQKELVKQYRVNLDLAEKCHKAELRESELREMMTRADQRREEGSIKCQLLEESLVSVKAAQEGDLKDLWRLVHCPDDSEDSDRSIEVSASTELLKVQIQHELEALRKKLERRESALSVVKSDKPALWHHSYKGRSCSSPLVDALNIECINVIKTDNPPRFVEGKFCADCHSHHTDHHGNRSVPLPRRHNRVHTVRNPSLPYGCSTVETVDGECCRKEPGDFDCNKQKRNLPLRFTFDRTDLGSFDSEDRDTPLAVPYESGMSKDSVEQGHLFRRGSYVRAIENQPGSTEEINGSRCRSYSFNSAIEQGQISPTGPPQTTTPSSSIGDTTPDSEGQDFLMCKGTPKYSSTPYQLSKPVMKSVNFHPNTYGKDNKSLENGGLNVFMKGEPCSTSQLSHQPELAKSTGIFPNNSHNLSVLLEEDPCGVDSSRFESGPSCLGSSGQQEDMSVEVWSLSRTDSNQSNSCSSRDSGHSSSISCFDGDDHVDMKGSEVTREHCGQHTSSISDLDCHTTNSNSSVSPKDSVNKNSAENVKPSASSEHRTAVSQTLNSKPYLVDNSARDMSPSERILLKFGGRSENKKTSTGGKPSLPKQHAVIVAGDKVDTRSGVCCDKPGIPEPMPSVSAVKVEGAVMKDTSDKGGQPDMKGPTGELQKPALMLRSGKTPMNQTNGREGQTIIMEEEETDSTGQGEGPKPVSNLAKIRQSHLAKRQHHLRQNKMPQLSELSEKESSDERNQGPPGALEVKTVGGEDFSHMTNGDVVMPSIPDEFLKKLGLVADESSSEELSEQEIENKFSSLSLAFKTDAQTLEKRLEIQERSRDIAEQNVDRELQGLRNGLATLNQICTDPQVREVLAKIQNHIEILEKSTARVSSRAEVYGAIQQEQRMSRAVDIMVQHVENIRRVHEREHAELEEARKLLQDSRSLGPSTLDIAGGDMLSRRSASVCQNNMFGGKLALPGGAPAPGVVTPSALKAIKLLKASKRRVSEVALPKVLGGSGAPNLHPSASMPRNSRFPLRPDMSVDVDEASVTPVIHVDPESSVSRNLDKSKLCTAVTSKTSDRRPYRQDARSRFQAAVASTTFKSAVTNTLRRTSLEKQSNVPSVSPSPTPPQVSRDNSADSTSKSVDVQDKEKQKNMEEEAFKKGYEQGLRANLGKDLSGLREQQNHINESLGDVMDSIDSQMEEPKNLKEIFIEKFNENVPKIHISGWRIRMTMGVFFIILAFISVIISLLPVSSAEHVEFVNVQHPLW